MTQTNTPPPDALSAMTRQVQAEYVEMPGMALTPTQMQRLWHIDGALCDAVIESLVTSGFLTRRSDRHYVRAHEERER